MCLILPIIGSSSFKLVKDNLSYDEMYELIEEDRTLRSSFPCFTQEWYILKYSNSNESRLCANICGTNYIDTPYYGELKSGETCKEIKTWYVFKP